MLIIACAIAIYSININSNDKNKDEKILITEQTNKVIENESESDVVDNNNSNVEDKKEENNEELEYADQVIEENQQIPVELSVTPIDKEMYSSTSLNIRKGPGTEYEKITHYNTNDKVVVTGTCDNGWVRVLFDEEEGYVNKKYLSEEKVEIKQYSIPEGMVFDGNVSQACKNKAIELYNKVPQNVKNAIISSGYQVIVSDNPSRTDGHAGVFYPSGYTPWPGPSICIYAGSVNKVNIAVIHEIGHFVDEYMGIRNGCGYTQFGCQGVTASAEWHEIYSAEVGLSGFPGYATDCCEDYFAETVWKAIVNPSWCQSTIPRSYEFAMRYVNAC